MSGRLHKLVATVPTGLEGGAVDEFKDVLGRKAEAERGKIRFEIASLEELKQVYTNQFDVLYLPIPVVNARLIA